MNHNTWKKLVQREWDNYKKSPIGVFSVDGLKGAELTGEIINKTIPDGSCLDVGCGALELPYYMKVADSVKFTGIDPLKGDKERRFDFIHGIAEELPFKDNEFDGVLFATSLDHVKNPDIALKEAIRVSKKYIFVWITLRPDKKYNKWKSGTQYNENHLWAFTEKSLIKSTPLNLMETKVVDGLQKIFTFEI